MAASGSGSTSGSVPTGRRVPTLNLGHRLYETETTIEEYEQELLNRGTGLQPDDTESCNSDESDNDTSSESQASDDTRQTTGYQPKGGDASPEPSRVPMSRSRDPKGDAFQSEEAQRMINYFRRQTQSMGNFLNPVPEDEGLDELVFVFQDERGDEQLLMVMEFCPGGNLSDFLKSKGGKLKPTTIQNYLLPQLKKGYKAMLEQNIIHRDIKP